MGFTVSNLEIRSLLTTNRKSYSYMGLKFQTTHYLTPQIKDGAAILKIDMTSFFCCGSSDVDKILQTGAE